MSGRLVLVCGASGAGKTYFTGKRIAGRSRVILYDPTGELARETGDEYLRVRGLASAARAVQWIAVQKPAAFRVAVELEPHQVDEWLWCLEMLRERRATKLTVAIDEADEIPYAAEKESGYGRLLRYGRRYTDETILAGQRLVGIPLRARTNCWLHVQYETGNYDDYKAIGQRYGPEAEKAVRELATGAAHRHAEFGRGARSNARPAASATPTNRAGRARP